MFEIRLDDPATWPDRLLAFFEKHRRELRAYAACDEWTTKDGAWGRDYVPMAHRPPNPFYPHRRKFLDTLHAEFFEQLALVGYHCTRLTDGEIAIIRDMGMTPPDAIMLRRRIEVLASEGRISQELARRLSDNNMAADPTRAGRIFWIFTAGPLKNELGVGDLFRNWGGEALYGSHDREPENGPVLRSIGRACIVEAAVPLVDLGSLAWPWNALTQQFLAGRGISVSDGDYVDRTELQVPADRIRRIILRHSSEFEALTGCAEWDPPLL